MHNDHRRLVRLAFLLFDAEGVKDEYQVARSHRLVRTILRRGKTRRAGDPYAAARNRLVWRILVNEHRPRASRLAWRTRTEPPAPHGDAARLRADWQPVTMRDGVAEVKPDLESRGCGRNFLLRGTFTGADGQHSKRTYVYHGDLPYPIRITAADGGPVAPNDPQARRKLEDWVLCSGSPLLHFLPISSIQLDERRLW